jgi:2-dehydro-3-deoxy-D-arabinonate dehydratase
MQLTHLGQYWCAARREVRLLGGAGVALDAAGRLRGLAYDLSGSLPSPRHRRRFRAQNRGLGWKAVSWTYSSLPFPFTELIEHVESTGRKLDGALSLLEAAALRLPAMELEALDREPSAAADHLVAPVIPRRAQAFGVTYLNSALEREVEGRRADYAYVYRAVKNRGERPELFLKATAPEHIVGPNGRMGLRRDLTNSETLEGVRCERLPVCSGIEPELAAVVYSSGEILGYTLANDVSGNRIENETVLYLPQAKHFTGALVLGPLLLVSSEQANPGLEITTRIFGRGRERLFERSINSAQINAPLQALIAWAKSHVVLQPGEVFSTGTGVVPDGEVKVLEEGMTVEISSPEIGCLRHGAAAVPEHGDLNLNYSRLEFEAGSGDED